MALYVFECTGCEPPKRFERIMKYSDLEKEVVTCEECKKPAHKILTTAHYAPITNNGASVRPNFSRRK
jgi:putative FmdB family regulatory protein